jgi:hypothetical protein
LPPEPARSLSHDGRSGVGIPKWPNNSGQCTVIIYLGICIYSQKDCANSSYVFFQRNSAYVFKAFSIRLMILSRKPMNRLQDVSFLTAGC